MELLQIIDLPDLIGYVREASAINGPNLSSVLPDLEVDDIQYELQNLDPVIEQLASYRSWDAPPPLGRRQGFTKTRGEIAPLGKSMRLNERELTRLRPLLEGLGDAGQDRLRSIYDDGVQAARAVRLRIEAARADVLTDGVLSINEFGFNLSATYAVPGAHIVTASPLWSNPATSTPVTNLVGWQEIYRGNNGGVNPDFWIVSDDVISDLIVNEEFRTLAGSTFGGQALLPSLLNQADINQVLQRNGIAPLVPFRGTLPDASGVLQPTLGIRKVIGVRRGLGNVLWTTPPSVALLASSGARLDRRDEAGIVAYVETTARPPSILTTAEAVAVPVLRDPKALFVATV